MPDRDEVMDAIREAHQAGMRPSDVQRKLAAGTLGELSRPIAMSPRSFFRRWARAAKEQHGGQEDQGGWGDPRMAAALRETILTDEGISEGLTDHEVSKRLILAEGKEITDHRLELYAHSVGNRRKQLAEGAGSTAKIGDQ